MHGGKAREINRSLIIRDLLLFFARIYFVDYEETFKVISPERDVFIFVF